MSRGLQLLTGFVAAIAIFSIGVFLYLTREIAPPNADRVLSIQPVVTPTDSDTVTFTIRQTGTTDQVAGEMVLNLADLSRSQIGTVQIDASAFSTDSDAVRLALRAEDDSNPFIRFQPVEISGLLGKASVGDTVQFQVTGDLTIAGVTRSVTFDVTATLQTADQLTGHAETVISRANFNLTIPADVGDMVTLRLNFTASAE